jgi:hypothetical protein
MPSGPRFPKARACKLVHAGYKVLTMRRVRLALYRLKARFVPQRYHNPVSLPVPLEVLNPYKSAVLSPRVPPCRPLSLSGSGYESEGRRFESCRARCNRWPVSRANADRPFLCSGAGPLRTTPGTTTSLRTVSRTSCRNGPWLHAACGHHVLVGVQCDRNPGVAEDLLKDLGMLLDRELKGKPIRRTVSRRGGYRAPPIR